MNIKNTTKYGIVMLGILSLVLLGVSLSGNYSQIELSNNYDGPMTVEVSGLQEELSYEDLVDRSNVILMGTVKEILPSKWNTLDGKRPNKSIEDFDSRDEIYTDVVVKVDEYLKNSMPSKEIIVRVLGGTVGEDTMIVEDVSSFKSGEKVLLYLSEDTYPHTMDIGPEHFVVTGYGKFKLTDDGEAVGTYETVRLEELLNTIEK